MDISGTLNGMRRASTAGRCGLFSRVLVSPSKARSELLSNLIVVPDPTEYPTIRT